MALDWLLGEGSAELLQTTLWGTWITVTSVTEIHLVVAKIFSLNHEYKPHVAIKEKVEVPKVIRIWLAGIVNVSTKLHSDSS